MKRLEVSYAQQGLISTSHTGRKWGHTVEAHRIHSTTECTPVRHGGFSWSPCDREPKLPDCIRKTTLNKDIQICSVISIPLSCDNQPLHTLTTGTHSSGTLWWWDVPRPNTIVVGGKRVAFCKTLVKKAPYLPISSALGHSVLLLTYPLDSSSSACSPPEANLLPPLLEHNDMQLSCFSF
jgi:hypothetical protein